MAVSTFYFIRNNNQKPPFYGGNNTWVVYDNAQLFSSKEDALLVIDTLENGMYFIQERIIKS